MSKTETLKMEAWPDAQQDPDTHNYLDAQEYNVILPERSLGEVAAIMGVSKRMVLHYENQAFKKMKTKIGAGSGFSIIVAIRNVVSWSYASSCIT